jgi:acetolactate synthase-1/2/3 large subunit
MDDGFVCGDSALALNGLADRLEARGYKADPELLADLRQVHDEVVATMRDGLGPYSALVQQLQQAVGRNFNWVRDVTVSNSTWGNRELRFFEPNAGVHATGGGIGMGMPMAIGAAIGAAESGSGRKTWAWPATAASS